MTHRWLEIVGVGEGGVPALGPEARDRIAAAETIIGPPRLLEGLAHSGANLAPWRSPLSTMIDQVKALAGTPTVVLATGDPMWFGIGATLTRHLDSAEFGITPHPSGFSLAAAEMRWPLQNIAAISLHGRAVEALHQHVLPGNRILALTSDRETVRAVAEMLISRGYGQSVLTALENLGGPRQRVTCATAMEMRAEILGDFLILAIDCVADAHAPLLPPIPGLPDNAFEHDGQITKRDVRAATLARLGPYPGALLWDIGAGSGSISIEWMRAARDARAIAFERDPGRAETILRNAKALGTPDLKLVRGEAPGSLVSQPAPDAVFIGGDADNEALFVAAWDALKPRGRMVLNAITLDGERVLIERQGRLGGELTRIEVSVLDLVGRHRVMRPRMAVVQWAAQKP